MPRMSKKETAVWDKTVPNASLYEQDSCVLMAACPTFSWGWKWTTALSVSGRRLTLIQLAAARRRLEGLQWRNYAEVVPLVHQTIYKPLQKANNEFSGPIVACTIRLHCRRSNYTVRQKKGTTFHLWINLFIRNVIWQNFVLSLLMKIIIDITDLFMEFPLNSHICMYTYMHVLTATLMNDVSDATYVQERESGMRQDSAECIFVWARQLCTVLFIVSISLLHKILNACQN